MGPKKKQPKNAFSFFLDDYVERERRKGRHISCRIAAEECAEHWKQLPQDEKQRYTDLAAEYKAKTKNDLTTKFTSTGMSYAEVERRQKLQREKVEKGEREMKEVIMDCTRDEIRHKVFYLVHCNYYCKTDEGVYVPGELALCKFSLKNGIMDTYHTLINPGSIPLGYALEAQTNINEVHKLPFPPYSEGNSYLPKIYDDVLDFIQEPSSGDLETPALYCLNENIAATEYILGSLREAWSMFRVYPLEKLLFYLTKKCTEHIQTDANVCLGFHSLTNSILEVEKDRFRYVTNISCNFHSGMEEKYENCSLAITQRFVYAICDYCCQYVDVKLVPGKHSQLKCDLQGGQRTASVAGFIHSSATAAADSKDDVKPIVEEISKFYGGSNAPEWTKITDSDFQNEIQDDLDDWCPPATSPMSSSGFNSNSRLNEAFPPLVRGRGRGRAQAHYFK